MQTLRYNRNLCSGTARGNPPVPAARQARIQAARRRPAMPSKDAIADKLRSFVSKRFPLAARGSLNDDDPLLQSGIIDSLGLLQVVEFIETEFDMLVSDEDMVSEIFGSIGALARYVEQRVGERDPGGG